MGGYPQVQVDVHVWDRIWVHVVWSGVSSAIFVSLSCVGGVRNVSIFRGKFAHYIFEGAWLRSTTKVNFDGNQAHRATQGILPPSKSLCHTGGVTRLGIYEVVFSDRCTIFGMLFVRTVGVLLLLLLLLFLKLALQSITSIGIRGHETK